MKIMTRSSRSIKRRTMHRLIPMRLLSFLLMLIFILITSVPGGIVQGHFMSAANPNPNAAPLLTESQCFYPNADTYVAYSASNPEIANTNYGGESTLQIQRTDVGDSRKLIFLRFDLSPIPSDANIVSADLELYLSQASVSSTYFLNRATSSWQEYSLTWNNNRPSFGGSYDSPLHTATEGRKNWNATQPVSDWVSGVFENYGFVIESGLLEDATSFTSRDAGLHDESPRLCVEWTTGDLDADLQVTGLEVTQAVQDLNNSVRLVAGKRTYVRLHVRSNKGDYRSFASLAINCDNFGRILYPVNPGTNGYIVVREAPDRNVQNHAFLFLLPSDCTDEAEQIQISGLVNPVTSWRGAYPPETDIGNNWSGEYFVTFETAPQLDTIVYLADYESDDGDSISTSVSDAYMMRSWLERAFPIPQTTMLIRSIDFGQITIDEDGVMTDPTSGDFNAELAAKRDWDLAHANWYGSITGSERHIRYYGMIDDSGGFMRGSASEIPGNVSSGPTGDGRWAWDTDGSFGDWYGAHETGHTLGRIHVNCDGTEGGPDINYPHTGGLISTATTGADALFGFDSGDLVDGIYGPTWSDIMSYCDWQWISDYTTHGILDYMQNNFTRSREARAEGSYLQVVGTIDARSGTTKLKPFFVLPDVVDAKSQIPGEYDIILKTGDGSELARYAFTPVPMDPGPSSPDLPYTQETSKLLISEMVPFVIGTDRVIIEGPSGILAEVSAGSATPSVTVLSPNGGENVTSDPITVSWSASDPDGGDQLSFSVEFSPDNGTTWELVAHGISGNQVDIPRKNLLSTEYEGLFRVWVSDGIHTSSDISDSGFRIPSQAPELTVLSPADGLVIAKQQSLHLQATAYSDIAGFLNNDQIRWVSVAKDGVLGFGADLVVTDLSLGVHNIAVIADDGKRTSSEIIEITVVADPSLLPPATDKLQAAPKQVALQPHLGMTSRKVSIDNASGTKLLNWQTVNLTSWIKLNRTSGSTPDQVTISVDTTGLEPGSYSANVGFLTPDISGGSLATVQVAFTIPQDPLTIPKEAFTIHLPLVLR